MRRVEAANPSLTVGAPNLAPEFSATFDTNLMMQVLAFPGSQRPAPSRMRRPLTAAHYRAAPMVTETFSPYFYHEDEFRDNSVARR